MPVPDVLANGRLKLVLQISGFVFFAGVAWWRVSVLETAVSKQGVIIEEIRATVGQAAITVSNIETRLDERKFYDDRDKLKVDDRLEDLEGNKARRQP